MLKISPTLRISFALVLMTISFLFSAQLLGLVPDPDKAEMEARRKICETLAVQFSIAAQNNNFPLIKATIEKIVDRNQDILSAALRDNKNKILAEAGNHDTIWVNMPEENSSFTHVRVPIFQGEKRWGIVEVSFAPLTNTSPFGLNIPAFYQLVIFITLLGFCAFILFMKRTLRHLDPTAVIPGRVKYALDALTEGVAILDEKNRIILANASFLEEIDIEEKEIIGRNIANIGWKIPEGHFEYPWVTAIKQATRITGQPLTLDRKNHKNKTFMVNGAPILDAQGLCRGALATFDDVTQLEHKNVQLEKTLNMLKKSRDEIHRQNQELNILATQDPLTHCLNRRSFFARLKVDFCSTKQKHNELSCIMCDIDHFKAINDTYGHSVGDEIIKLMSGTLKNFALTDNYVCRYGGEEFVVLLPSSTLELAHDMGEKIRLDIEAMRFKKKGIEKEVRFTASFGVSSSRFEATTPEDLIDQADKALYISKNLGRNRVTNWDNALAKQVFDLETAETHRKEIDTTDHSKTSQKELDTEIINMRAHIKELQYNYKQRTAELQRIQRQDNLTGLPNRISFIDQIQQEIAKNTSRIFAVVLLDVNKLKRINSTLGRQVGDQLLKEIGERIHHLLRTHDRVARLENGNTSSNISHICSDEFGILLTDLTKKEDSIPAITRIIEHINKPFYIEENKVYTHIGVGVSIYPDNANQPDLLLRYADIALHFSKSQNPNSYQFYDSSMQQISTKQLQLENHLRHAIENDEFLLHYQPKIDLHNHEISGVEALIRWHYPKTGMINPDEFIPVAEHTGLINDIGEWVIRTACKQAQQWQKLGLEVPVSVNLSAIQFHQHNLIELIVSILDETQLDPRFLELELTETAIMKDTDSAVATLNMLHNLGIRIAIDDFGTGYSSLNHLKRFPIDTVKIDRGFIKNVNNDFSDAAIVTAILDISHKMGLTVIAEGIETKDQLKFVDDLECEEIQGYLFSRPLPADEITAILKKPNIILEPLNTRCDAETVT